MVRINRLLGPNEDFKALTVQLDKELNQNYLDVQSYYDQFNKIELIDTVVIAYENELPVGCGCFKAYDDISVELKRMFVRPDHRGKGISRLILHELEKWAVELGFTRAVLETGIKQIEAIGLYVNMGYNRIENYGQYKYVITSICFDKIL